MSQVSYNIPLDIINEEEKYKVKEIRKYRR